jgi:hypothetical protein
MKSQRRQNISLNKNVGIDKMLALTKYGRCQNIDVDKILGVDKILALTKY